MAVLYAFEDLLLSRDQLPKESTAPKTSTKVKSFTTLKRHLEIPSIEPGEDSDIVKFVEIGINRPLKIVIRHIYTGRFPRKSPLPFATKKDMLVTSAMKGTTNVYQGQPRAVNFLRKAVGQNENIPHIDPLLPGTSTK